MLIAHIRKNGDLQYIKEHSRNTANIASNVLSDIQLNNTGYLAGLLHDMGKCSEVFTKYITDSFLGKPVQKGSVVHTFTGVRYLMEHFHDASSTSITDIACELVAYAVGSHHGLFDAVDLDQQSGFQYRMEERQEYYDEAQEGFLKECADEREIGMLFDMAQWEIASCLHSIRNLVTSFNTQVANQELCFYLGILSRLLLSAVIEGDRKDTAAFMKGNNERRLLNQAVLPPWDEILKNLERYIISLSSDSPISVARKNISDQCKAFCDCPSGLYRLNVPTGGGKTLSALRFAVAHAFRKGKRRILYVAPLITILEQNADVIRTAVGNPDLVLEHHSNVVNEQDDTDELQAYELLLENWDAPIIITTLVQLLNTFFLYKTSSIRRFHALANSVLILDEVQTVPSNMLSLFNLAMNFLSGICHTTVLLCSATQPCLEKTDHAMRINPETPVLLDNNMRSIFSRTEIKFANQMIWADIPWFIRKKMENCRSLLVICNKKGEAEQLFAQLQDSDWHCFHLSASMCMSHRRMVMRQMGSALEASQKGKGKTLCIATQVTEAGVDVSFESVIRLSAGLDNIIQAAGRCNRNGESQEKAKVYIIDCMDENLTGLKDIQAGKDATRSLLYAYQKNSEAFGNDLASDSSIDYYYHQLYSAMKKHYQDDVIKELDNATLFDLLAQNEKLANKQFPHFMKQSFKTAGRYFSVFDNDTIDAIVPYQDGKRIIQQLTKINVHQQLEEAQLLIHQAKQFTVSLYDYQVQRMHKQGALYPIAGGATWAVTEDYYDDNTGIVTQSQSMNLWEV